MSRYALGYDTLSVARAGDGSALQRIYATARMTAAARIELDEEIERRLALIVLFTYGDKAPTGDAPAADDEHAIAETCVDRLLARTTAT